VIQVRKSYVIKLETEKKTYSLEQFGNYDDAIKRHKEMLKVGKIRLTLGSYHFKTIENPKIYIEIV
jgi:hypothetical protein